MDRNEIRVEAYLYNSSKLVVCTIKNNPRIILFEVETRRHRDKFA